MVAARESFGSENVPSLLLSAAQQGDLSRLGRLLDDYRTYLFGLAESELDEKLRGRVGPSDIVQETMLEAHRDFHQFRGCTEREFRAWLRQILANTLASVVKSQVLTQKRDVRRDVSLGNVTARCADRERQDAIPLIARTASPLTIAQRRERAAILKRVMSELSESQRQVLVLRNLQGLKFSEVAERMGRSIPASKMLWRRAIQRLRKLYEGQDEG